MSKEEAMEFLRDLIRKVDAQDNRATAKPYFYVIQQERWRVAHDDYYSGETKQVWIDTSGTDEYHEWESREAYIADLVENDRFPQAEAEARADEHLREFVMERYFDEDNVFFTEEGFNEHVRQNGHNLGKRGKGFHSYVKHAFRNPEIKGLFEAIRALVAPDEPHPPAGTSEGK